MEKINLKSVLFFVLFFVLQSSMAQLFIGDNNFIFNKNMLFYVKGDIEIKGSDSNFYLREQGQLLQGTAGSSTNKGEGKLSVFQEGTVNEFAYNYWCSPVGNAGTVEGNENFGITMIKQPTGLITFNDIVSTSSYNGSTTSTSLNIAKYWIWKYIASSVYEPGGAGWIHVQDASSLSAGQGFTMKGVSGDDATDVGESTVNNPIGSGGVNDYQRYEFRGKPNDGTIPVTVGAGDYTLTGNPYPSALHVNAFLLDSSNSNCDGIAYYWEQDKEVNSHYLAAYRGGYGTYSPVNITSKGVYVPATFNTYNPDGTLNTIGSTSSLSIQRKYAPIGQGFKIKGLVDGSVTLKNSHRVFYRETDQTLGDNLSQFERQSPVSQTTLTNSNDVPHIKIDAVINNQFTRQIALILIPEATNGVDRGIDAKLPGNLPNDAYFFLDNDKYVIEGVDFGLDKRIPIGIKVTGTCSFKFSVAHFVNFDATQSVYIYDHLDQSYHNIRDDFYEVTLSEGNHNNRFEITFIKEEFLSLNESATSDFFVVQNNTAQLLTISNPHGIKIVSASVFDITGKLVLKQLDLINKTTYEFSTSSLSDGVYIVKLIADEGKEFCKKIIIKNINY